VSFHIKKFANLAGYPATNPKYLFVYTSLTTTQDFDYGMNILNQITRKVPSSGARFWETSMKGSLEGFKYLSSKNTRILALTLA
jgi:hypothetical protein